MGVVVSMAAHVLPHTYEFLMAFWATRAAKYSFRFLTSDCLDGGDA